MEADSRLVFFGGGGHKQNVLSKFILGVAVLTNLDAVYGKCIFHVVWKPSRVLIALYDDICFNTIIRSEGCLLTLVSGMAEVNSTKKKRFKWQFLVKLVQNFV